MKKLMIAAGAVAIVSGAFAAASGDPLVYDYKASVKHMYLTEVNLKNVPLKNGDTFTGVVYQKIYKNANLKGYLIMDDDGATSQAIVKRTVRKISNNIPQTDLNSLPATGLDFGRNRGFLVVLNTSLKGNKMPAPEAWVKYAKVLPAVLDAKWIDRKFSKKHENTKDYAEGTLYVGGDMVAPSRYNLDRIDYADGTDPDGKLVIATGIFERGHKLGGDADEYARVTAETQTPDNYFGTLPPLPVSAEADYADGKWTAKDGVSAAAGIAAIGDYRWTSLHLFGWYNGPNWFAGKYNGPFDNFEKVWDLNLPADLQVGFAYFHPYFHDTWMNGAGFGWWTKDPTKTSPKRCCGRVKKETTTWSAPVLESLSGNLKGGLFICTENGIFAEGDDYMFFDTVQGGRGGWEDQFVTARLASANIDKIDGSRGHYIFRGDRWQNDMWQDGNLQQETTDCISGTWSIKLNTKFLATGGVYEKFYNKFIKDGERGLVTAADIEYLTQKALANVNANSDLTRVVSTRYVEAATGLEVLVGTIKAAVLDLSPKAVFINGNEISDLAFDYQDSQNQIPVAVPAITPAFSSYYGLANWETMAQRVTP